MDPRDPQFEDGNLDDLYDPTAEENLAYDAINHGGLPGDASYEDWYGDWHTDDEEDYPR